MIYRVETALMVVLEFLLFSVLLDPAAGADKVRVAFSAVSPTQGVLWVADVGGLFKKNDLNAEIIYTRADRNSGGGGS